MPLFWEVSNGDRGQSWIWISRVLCKCYSPWDTEQRGNCLPSSGSENYSLSTYLYYASVKILQMKYFVLARTWYVKLNKFPISVWQEDSNSVWSQLNFPPNFYLTAKPQNQLFGQPSSRCVWWNCSEQILLKNSTVFLCFCKQITSLPNKCF